MEWRLSSKLLGVGLLVVVAGSTLSGCGPGVYQRAYDYCLQRGGVDYECDRFARDEANHAAQHAANNFRQGQQAVSPAARQPAKPDLPLCYAPELYGTSNVPCRR